MQALVAVLTEHVLAPVVQERDLGNILNSLNLLRLFALLQEP